MVFLTDAAAKMGLGFEVLPPTELVTVAGQELVLPCQPSRTKMGLPDVSWTSNERIVDDDRRYALPNGSLLITEVRPYPVMFSPQERNIVFFLCCSFFFFVLLFVFF